MFNNYLCKYLFSCSVSRFILVRVDNDDVHFLLLFTLLLNLSPAQPLRGLEPLNFPLDTLFFLLSSFDCRFLQFGIFLNLSNVTASVFVLFCFFLGANVFVRIVVRRPGNKM